MPDAANIATLSAALIRRFEGCVLEAYPDPKRGWAVPTIGYGCTGPDIVRGLRWTKEKAESELARRLATEFVPAALSALGRPLPDAAVAAIVSMLWNVGAGAVKAPRLAAALKSGDPQRIAAQFPLWSRVGTEQDPDLLKRRLKERAIFLEAIGTMGANA